MSDVSSSAAAPEIDAGPRRRGGLRWDLVRSPHDVRALLGGTVVVFLMIFWAVDDGGFDAGTWYWGALVCLAALAGSLALGRSALSSVPRSAKVAIVFFALYVAWSYLSMIWAPDAGLALQGSNRALLYLLLFTLIAVLPWRTTTALLALVFFATGIGVTAIALLSRLALGDHVSALFFQGRLISPTGYFNSTAALFTIGTLVATALSARRGLPGLLRGLLLSFAAADLMLAVTVQSRGWLFTLPLVGLYSILVIAGRLRSVAAALLPSAGTLAIIHPLLRLYDITGAAALRHSGMHVGRLALLSCAAVFVIGTLASWIDALPMRPPMRPGLRATLGTLAVVLALAGIGGGLEIVSHGHPGAFVSRQWHGFTHETTRNTSSHFDLVGSGRYDIWKSALSAFRAHPLGGLGQDNFGDYYLTHRHTTEEPLWTHSLEMRLLAHTGIVGTLLFVAFLAAALTAAIRARRRGPQADRMLVGAALLPLGVWLIHGSIDWFWEVPALSGPALGFLAMAARLRPSPAVPDVQTAEESPRRVKHRARPIGIAAGALALVTATLVLGLPYLALRELTFGESASHTDVAAALADFRNSHRLNPLMSDPGVLGGSVALVNGRDAEAAALFRQAIAREPGQWVAWLGRGLAASAQGQVDQARRAFRVAAHLNADQPVTHEALRRAGSRHPLTPAEAFAKIDYQPQ